MKFPPFIAILLLILPNGFSPAFAQNTDCHSLPGAPVFHAADALATLPTCHVAGLATTITISSATRIEWQGLSVQNSASLYIISKPGSASSTIGHASFHEIIGGHDADIQGTIHADGPLTLQNASGGDIVVGQSGNIYAPDITLTTLQAADPSAYLTNGQGRFDAIPNNQATVIINGDLLATSGSAQVLGTHVVLGQRGKVEAPMGKAYLFAGPNANVQANSVTPAALVNAPNSVISHSGIIRALEVELRAVPGYDSLFCPAGLCGGERGITIGGEITAQKVILDTTHPLNNAVQNYTEGTLGLVSGNLTHTTSHIEPISVSGPIEDEGTAIAPPIAIPPLPGVNLPASGVLPPSAVAAPLSLTYSHLNAVPRRKRSQESPILASARGAQGGKPKTTANQAAKPVVSRGSFFGVPTAIAR